MKAFSVLVLHVLQLVARPAGHVCVYVDVTKSVCLRFKPNVLPFTLHVHMHALPLFWFVLFCFFFKPSLLISSYEMSVFYLQVM